MSDNMVSPEQRQNETGAMIPLVLVCMIGLFAAIGFVIDLSRLEAIVRKAQSAVDAAALAGATNTQVSVFTDPLSGELAQSESDGWANVKKSVLSALAQADLIAVDSVAESAFASQAFRFDDAGSPATDTTRDCPGYQYQEGVRGNVRVATARYIFCYWQDPITSEISRQKFDLESRIAHFCKANAVSVEMKITNIGTVFAHLMGIGFLEDVDVGATAYIEEPVPTVGSLCDSVNCDEIGIQSILIDEGLVDPLAIPAGITEEPCPMAPPPTCP